MTVVETLGDCAYGGGGTLQEFEEAGRALFAKVPKEHQRGGLFPKSRFTTERIRSLLPSLTTIAIA